MGGWGVEAVWSEPVWGGGYVGWGVGWRLCGVEAMWGGRVGGEGCVG